MAVKALLKSWTEAFRNYFRRMLEVAAQNKRTIIRVLFSGGVEENLFGELSKLLKEPVDSDLLDKMYFYQWITMTKYFATQEAYRKNMPIIELCVRSAARYSTYREALLQTVGSWTKLLRDGMFSQ